MSTDAARDFVDFLIEKKVGTGDSVFTSGDQGAYVERPLAIVLRETPSSESPEVTINADYTTLTISVMGAYGQSGEAFVQQKAFEVYNILRLILDVEINGTLYYYAQADRPPAHVGFDTEKQRTSYEFSVTLFRYLGEINGN